MKRALIIGSSGQDGTLLFEHRSKECAVVGLDVGKVVTHGTGDLSLPAEVQIHDRGALGELLVRFPADELYFLAARHNSSEERPDDATELIEGARLNFVAFVHALENVLRYAPQCHVFYAGSSHMFGAATEKTQSEATPFGPRTPYGITKVAGAQACALFRRQHDVHASVGILYNHESPIRAPKFVSQRIAQGAKKALRDPSFKLALGSLSSVVDWGYAVDFVDAMARIVAQPTADDYIVATGEPHTVRDMAEIAFGAVGLDYRNHVHEDTAIVKSPPGTLVGDSSKLRARTGWKPSVTFEEMVKIMVAAAP